jgi:hypothetical protein
MLNGQENYKNEIVLANRHVNKGRTSLNPVPREDRKEWN